MTVATVAALAQLVVQIAGLPGRCFGVYAAGTGAVERFEKEAS